MDKISKTLAKIPSKQRRAVLLASKKIKINDLKGLDIKKLKGSKGLFRARVGNYRVIYQAIPGQNPIVVDVARRDDKTYKNY